MSVLNKLHKAKDLFPLASTKAAIQSAVAYPYYCNCSMLSCHLSAKPLENPLGHCFPFTNTWTEALEDSVANLAGNSCSGTFSTSQSWALMSSLCSIRAAFTCCCLNPKRSSWGIWWHPNCCKRWQHLSFMGTFLSILQLSSTLYPDFKVRLFNPRYIATDMWTNKWSAKDKHQLRAPQSLTWTCKNSKWDSQYYNTWDALCLWKWLWPEPAFNCLVC